MSGGGTCVRWEHQPNASNEQMSELLQDSQGAHKIFIKRIPGRRRTPCDPPSVANNLRKIRFLTNATLTQVSNFKRDFFFFLNSFGKGRKMNRTFTGGWVGFFFAAGGTEMWSCRLSNINQHR